MAKFKPLECSVSIITAVKLDPLDLEDQKAINKGYVEKEVLTTFQGIVVRQMTKLDGQGNIVDLSRVYNPETKQTLSYPSKIVFIEEKEMNRSINKDWK
jgi:hypothetical protein